MAHALATADIKTTNNKSGVTKTFTPASSEYAKKPSNEPASKTQHLAGWMLLIFACLFHTHCTWRYLGGWATFASPWPLLLHDHPYIYYNAVRASTFLQQSGATAGYDPTFMGGYAFSAIGSTNLTLPLIFALIPTAWMPITYKFYVLFAVLFLPIGLAWSAYLWRLSWLATGWAVLLWAAHFWSSWDSNYLLFGMIAYLSLLPAILVLAAFLARFLQQPGPTTAWQLALIATFACCTHLLMAPLLLPPFALVCLFFCRRLTGVAHVWLWSAIFVCLLVHCHWWWPMLQLWATKATVPAFFVNPEVGTRLLQMVAIDDAMKPLLFWAAIGGSVIFWRRQTESGRSVAAVTLAWIFFLAYPAGWLRTLDFLQPGRNEALWFYWLSLPAGLSFEYVCRQRRRLGLAIAILSGLILCEQLMNQTILSFPFIQFARSITYTSTRPTSKLSWAQLSPTGEQLQRTLTTQLAPTTASRPRRVFYEESNNASPDPFHKQRLSSILALSTGCEFIGGPWLYSTYQTNATQVGDGLLLGQADWSAARLHQLAQLYRVEALVCWSPAARRTCLQHPELFPFWFDNGRILVCGIRRPLHPLEAAGITWSATPNRIDLYIPPQADPANSEDARLRQERIVTLPYHWVPGLHTEPKTQIRPTQVDGDPVPWITLVDPPSHLQILFSPW